MYNAYFGFREKPFKLVPNPEYLFLSKSHEEALAHLHYAVSQGDGFVEITGEVGTGKTTLCRAFLEGLDEDALAAYIFNPRLGPKQLIQSIADEFGITYAADSTKDLIDKLNAFLMQKKEERKRVIVIIDEAQNLSKVVLEQLRLLSNLETNKEKLLQIILVGQPELAEMLDSHDLRQIGQRISLRYQINPLSFEETREYIQYRLNIASQRRSVLFEPSAFRHIYKYSRGIPRLINIACDRALLTAFGLDQRSVTGATAKISVAEMTHRGHASSIALMDGRKALAIFLALSAVIVALLYHQPLVERVTGMRERTAPQTQPAAAAHSPLPSPAAADDPPRAKTPDEAANAAAPTPIPATDTRPPAPAPEPPVPVKAIASLAEHLKALDNRSSRYSALRNALAAWGAAVEPKPYLDRLDDDPTFFSLYAKTSNLLIHRLEAEIQTLRNMNMPAVLELRTSLKAPPLYLALTGIEGDRLFLTTAEAGQTLRVDANELWQNWTGVAYVPWKNFLTLTGLIPGSAPPDSVLALKMLLRENGFKEVPMSQEFDPATRRAVEKLQAKYGVPVDGLVGSLTKIILYRENKGYDIPRLVRN
jgi:general secretion pathway protein A